MVLIDPVHITKYFRSPRLVLFCGLEDYVGSRGPDSRPEPYITAMRGLVRQCLSCLAPTQPFEVALVLPDCR